MSFDNEVGVVPYDRISHGELVGTATALQMPSVPCKMVCFKASYDNTGRVCIGSSTSVTMTAGSTSTTAGFQLAAGEMTPWFPCSNVNVFWRICTSTADDLTYIAIG